jgi:hypothetical protein
MVRMLPRYRELEAESRVQSQNKKWSIEEELSLLKGFQVRITPHHIASNHFNTIFKPKQNIML